MKRLALLFLLLTSSSLYSQAITVGDAIPQKAVDEAKQTIASAQPKILKLAVGEFEVIDPAKGIVVPLLWLGTDDTTITKIQVPSGQAVSIYSIRRGDKVAKHHTFAAKAYAWTILMGAKVGLNAITLIKSGDKPELIPVIVDTISVTVGDPAPVPAPVDPDVPSTDPLVLAALADIKAGKGNVEDVLNYAAIYSMFSTQVKNDTTLVTVGDLFNQMNAAIDRLLGSDIEKAFPTLRKAMGKELSGKIPTNAALKIADNKDAISAEFVSVAKRLGAIK